MGQEQAERRYCEDCRFFSAQGDLDNARCLYPRRETTAKELVSRQFKPTQRFCDYERGRTGDDSCGAEAKWFAPKIAADQEAA